MQNPEMESGEISRQMQKKGAELGGRPCAWGLRNPGPGRARGVDGCRAGRRIMANAMEVLQTGTPHEVRKAEGARQSRHERSWNCAQ